MSGLVVGVGILMLLVTLGLAIGFSITEQPWWTNANTANAVGTQAAGAVAITLFLTYFVAGLVSAKAFNRADRGAAVLQGTIVWVLFSVFFCVLVTLGLGSELVRTATNSGVVANSENLSADFLPEGNYTGNLNLEDPDNITMRLDNPQVPVMVATMTGLSQDEAETEIKDLQRRVALVRDDPAAVEEVIRNFLSHMGERARQRATEANSTILHNARVGAWVTFGMLAFALVITIAGAVAGTPGRAGQHVLLVRQ